MKKENFALVCELLEQVDDKTAQKWIQKYNWWNNQSSIDVIAFFEHASSRILSLAIHPSHKTLFNRNTQSVWDEVAGTLVLRKQFETLDQLAVVLTTVYPGTHKNRHTNIIPLITTLQGNDFHDAMSRINAPNSPLNSLLSQYFPDTKKFEDRLGQELLVHTAGDKADYIIQSRPHLHTASTVQACLDNDRTHIILTLIERIQQGQPLLDDPTAKMSYAISDEEWYEYGDDESYEKTSEKERLNLAGVALLSLKMISKRRDFQVAATNALDWTIVKGWNPPSMTERVDALSYGIQFWNEKILKRVSKEQPIPSEVEVGNMLGCGSVSLYRTRFEAFRQSNPSAKAICDVVETAYNTARNSRPKDFNARIGELFLCAPEKNQATVRKLILSKYKKGAHPAELAAVLERAQLNTQTVENKTPSPGRRL